MPAIKHAKVISEEQEAVIVRYLKTTRDAQRNLVMFLLSIKAGLHAIEKASDVGGSLRDVQSLAGHASLVTTQRYVEEDQDVKWKLVKLL